MNPLPHKLLQRCISLMICYEFLLSANSQDVGISLAIYDGFSLNICFFAETSFKMPVLCSINSLVIVIISGNPWFLMTLLLKNYKILKLLSDTAHSIVERCPIFGKPKNGTCCSISSLEHSLSHTHTGDLQNNEKTATFYIKGQGLARLQPTIERWHVQSTWLA